MPLSKAYQSITQLNSTFPCLKTWSPFAGGKKKRKAMMLLGGSMEACFSSSSKPENKGSFSIFIVKVELWSLKASHFPGVSSLPSVRGKSAPTGHH